MIPKEDKEKLIRNLINYSSSYIKEYTDYEITHIYEMSDGIKADIQFDEWSRDQIYFSYLEIFTYLNSK